MVAPRRQTVHKIDGELEQGVHGIDGGKPGFSGELTNNNRVGSGVELLDQAAQNHGQDEGRERPGDAALGQIQFFFHVSPLSTKNAAASIPKRKKAAANDFTRQIHAQVQLLRAI